ncbi:MAG: InlB B-repeat-containing protein, partial [Erysipelotrichaceae bacterium]|nr:InlB B-repeat-containing protein [Erysipelotrichaceae bacterium]
TYEMKGKDSAEIYVGILGTGDPSMWFSIGFTSFGALPQAYLLMLDPNGGKLTSASSYEGMSGKNVTISDPERDGYTFVRWVFTKEAGQLNGKTYTFASANAALKAEWTPNSYPITYVLNGGENDPSNPSSYTVEDHVILKDPSRANCRFLGWKEGNEILPGSTGEKTFTAEWALLDYPIRYVLDGGRNHPDNPSSYTYDDDITLKDAEKDGYAFTGWKEGNRIPKGSSGEKTFTATYEAVSYPVEYILYGGTNHPSNPVSYTILEEYDILDAYK